MSIVPSIRRNIFFNNPFPDSIKEEVCKKVFEKIRELGITSLYDMTYNYSSEGGFELPKTTEWNEYLNQQSQYTRNIHVYQSSRQLRFSTDNKNNINGAYCKDGLNIFTDYELDSILNIVNVVNNSSLLQ
jgi:hypothetical protein